MNWRVPFGLIVAPVLPAACVAVVMEGFVSGQWHLVPGTFLLVLTFAEPASILIAGPTYLLLRKFFKVGLVECLTCGGIIGCLVGILGFVVGVFAGALFWLIALRPLRKSAVPGELAA